MTNRRKTGAAPAPAPVLDYPAPGTAPSTVAPQQPTPTSAPPIPQRTPGTGPAPDPQPPYRPAGGGVPASGMNTTALAAKIAEVLRAGGLTALSQRLQTAGLQTASLRLPGARRFWWAYLLIGLAAAAVIIRIAAVLAGALNDPLTTLQYGEVRTTHLSALFGLPGETSTSPSLITATNDHGIGHIWLLPAGHAAQASVLEIPLTDLDSDGRMPLKLALDDVDGDGHPDVLVMLGDSGTTYVALMDTGKATLRPPTEEERRRLTLHGQTH